MVVYYYTTFKYTAVWWNGCSARARTHSKRTKNFAVWLPVKSHSRKENDETWFNLWWIKSMWMYTQNEIFVMCVLHSNNQQANPFQFNFVLWSQFDLTIAHLFLGIYSSLTIAIPYGVIPVATVKFWLCQILQSFLCTFSHSAFIRIDVSKYKCHVFIELECCRTDSTKWRSHTVHWTICVDYYFFILLLFSIMHHIFIFSFLIC